MAAGLATATRLPEGPVMAATAFSSGRVNVEPVGPVTVARPRDTDLTDGPTIDAMANRVYRLITDSGCRRLVINLGNMVSMSSTMIGKLIEIRRRLREVDGALALCELTPGVANLFALLALRQIFAVYETESDAMKALQAPMPPA
jgi:anti-anti-sigma factor